MKRHIPNIITLGNLTCGLMAIMYAFSDTPWIAPYFIFGGLFLDFFDGFFARILKVNGELGKQLDSLADMVTFGVAPGVLMFHLMFTMEINMYNFLSDVSAMIGDVDQDVDLVSGMEKPSLVGPSILCYVSFLIPLLSAYRLAKFNISTNQTNEFIGLPTPANAVFLSSVAMILFNNGLENSLLMDFRVYLAVATLIIIFSLLLNANLPLIALKFKTFGWKGNEARFIFLGVALLVILTSMLISNIFVSIPIIILLYLIISIINNYTKKQHEI